MESAFIATYFIFVSEESIFCGSHPPHRLRANFFSNNQSSHWRCWELL